MLKVEIRRQGKFNSGATERTFRIDEILALHTGKVTSFKDLGSVRAWKGQDWETMDRLHSKGYISDPKSNAKSVVLSEDGERRSKELFAKYFSLARA